MVKNYTTFTTADEEYDRDPRLKREDVKALQDWASKQTHLPPITELKMLRFLHSNYYKIEATKQCIEHYFTIRANCDEIFSHHDVSSKVTRDACQMMYSNLVISKPERKVVMLGLHDPNPDLLTVGPVYCFIDIMSQLIYAQTGASDEHIVIVDGSNVRISHVLKIGLMATKILMFYVQQAVPIRLKGVHIVNMSLAVEKLYALFKPFLKGDLVDRVYIHSNLDGLYKHLPKECIPTDLGGYGPSYNDMHADQCKMVEENAKWIEELGKEKADESKRQKKINFGDMFGYEGSFKKLQID